MVRFISVALVVAILATFLLALQRFVVNIPSYDDYAATLIFIKLHYFENHDAVEKFRALFVPHGEHYIVISRLSAAIAYMSTGTINFSALVWYQNLYLVGVFGLIIQLIRQQHIPLFPILIPVTSFLFSLSFWQVSFYYWGGVQYYAVFFFSFLALYNLEKATPNNRIPFFYSICLATLSILSFGNGLIVLPVGFFLLAVQRKSGYLWAWTGFSILCIGLFLSGFHPSFSSKPAFNPEWMSRLFFTYLGSFLYVNPVSQFWRNVNILLCYATGLGVFALWLRLLLKGYAFRQPLLYCLLSFPILTGALIALARFDTKAAGGIAPRYQFFSQCIPLFLLLIFYKYVATTHKDALKPIIAISLIVWGLSFWNNWQAAEQNTVSIAQTIKDWQKSNKSPLVYYNHDPAYSVALTWALNYGIYKLPPDIHK